MAIPLREAPSPTPAPAPAPIDARPVLVRNDQNIWSRAEHERDRIYDAFAKVVEAEGIEPQLLKSPPYAYPPWVRLELWIPQESRATTDRSWATVTIHPKACHKYEFEFHVSYFRNGKKKDLPRVVAVEQRQIRALVSFLLRKDHRPSFSRFRQPGSILLLRPKNKVALRKGALATAGTWLLLAGFLGPYLLIQARLAGEVALPTLLLLVAAIPLGILLLVVARRRRRMVKNEGKPQAEPRSIARVDSWQTVIFGGGGEAASLHRRFTALLDDPPIERFRWHQEKVWYWGLDGKEEREQLVLSAGRGLVFCQIYQYGKDLYIGWDGHLNHGQWVEVKAAQGVDRGTGKPITFMTTTPGTQRPSEYDLIDLSCLMEWTHAQLVKLSKQLVEELQIDQEIDFTILRGARQSLTAGQQKEGRGRIKNVFKRTG
jgi:hypothetical protein